MSFNFDVPSTVITLASSSKLATRRMDVDGEDWMVVLKKSVKHNGLPERLRENRPEQPSLVLGAS